MAWGGTDALARYVGAAGDGSGSADTTVVRLRRTHVTARGTPARSPFKEGRGGVDGGDGGKDCAHRQEDRAHTHVHVHTRALGEGCCACASENKWGGGVQGRRRAHEEWVGGRAPHSCSADGVWLGGRGGRWLSEHTNRT